jgi:hypothetical protein
MGRPGQGARARRDEPGRLLQDGTLDGRVARFAMVGDLGKSRSGMPTTLPDRISQRTLDARAEARWLALACPIAAATIRSCSAGCFHFS